MSPAGFLVPRVGGDGLNRVGDKAALDDMGSERDVRPLCPRSAFGWHELAAVGLFRVGDKAAVDDMGSERDVGPLCPRTAFWCHKLAAVGFIALGTKLR